MKYRKEKLNFLIPFVACYWWIKDEKSSTPVGRRQSIQTTVSGLFDKQLACLYNGYPKSDSEVELYNKSICVVLHMKIIIAAK